MRFREATAADIPQIVALWAGRNALPLSPRVRAALPALLQRIVASPVNTLTLFEESCATGMRAFSFACSLFVRESLIDDYLAAPYPSLLNSVLARLLDGERPLLTLDELRRAMAADGATVAIFPMPLGNLDFADPRVGALRTLAPQAFVRCHAGYRLRALYYEVFTDEVAAYLRSGGYRLLHDFADRAGSDFIPADSQPRMLRLSAADLPPGAMSMASQMFDPPRPHLGLTPGEQRVALRALDGSSDRALAESLGLALDTVRSNWRSIYRRLADAAPGVTSFADGSGTARGQEKRRVAIEYLRQNMHELRPYEAGAARARRLSAAR